MTKPKYRKKDDGLEESKTRSSLLVLNTKGEKLQDFEKKEKGKVLHVAKNADDLG